MVVVRIIGGLGNQMFQYVAARLLADKLGVELLLDLRASRLAGAHPCRLERFSVRAREARDEELRAWPAWHRRISARLPAFLRFGPRWYEEPSLAYDSGFWSLQAMTYIMGYFQSERYFAHREPVVRRDLTLRVPVADAPNLRIAQLAGSSESVAIHVRRGDYISDASVAKVHGHCSLRYYEEAVSRAHRRVSDARFFVFSNDLEWCRQNLVLGGDTVYVDGNAGRPDIDLYLMSQCKHHIISNSSFSWWGAWLGAHARQAVFVPHPWFDSMTLNAEDLVPARWIRLAK